MSKLKYSPGPWEYEKNKTGQHKISSKLGRWIADTPWLPNLQDQENLANTRLIAAAPDMLEVLIEMSKISTKNGWVWTMIVPIIEKTTGLTIEEVLNEYQNR